jgi:hypothetical protein
MNMNFIFKFAEVLTNLFYNWLSSNKKEWAWCRVDNRDDRF